MRILHQHSLRIQATRARTRRIHQLNVLSPGMEIFAACITPCFDMLDKAALPDFAPTGQHTYKVIVPQTEGTVSVRVDLRGVMLTEHPNRQKTFRFKGVDDICHCWAQACNHGVDLYWLAPPPPRRAAAKALPGPAAAADAGDQEEVGDVDPVVAPAGGPHLYDGLPPAPGPGYRRVEPGDSSSSSSESDGDGGSSTTTRVCDDDDDFDFMQWLCDGSEEENEEPVPEQDKKKLRRCGPIVDFE